MTLQFNTSPLVSPSLLSADFSHLAEALAQLEVAQADWVHVDVMDGHFVPNLTIGPPVIKALRKHSKLPFDVHLMIDGPSRYLVNYAGAGADIITVHQEACSDLQQTLRQIRELNCLAGVSIKPATPVDVLKPVLDEIDLILVMSVEPGFGGQTFIENSLQKLMDVKALVGERPIYIEVDGGISPENAKEVRDAGAQVLVAGSAVFNAKQPMSQVVEALRHPAGLASHPGTAI